MTNRELPDDHEARSAVLSDLFEGRASTQSAAERTATLTLEDGLESGLNVTWGTILATAYDSPNHLEKIADMLIAMARLPAPKDEHGNQLKLYDLRMWTDLPMLGWEINDEWNSLEVPGSEPDRTKAINAFVNINKLTALLLRSGGEPFIDFDIYVMLTMQRALEFTVAEAEPFPLDAVVPAAAALISVIGSQMRGWEKGFDRPEGQGDPGEGGPLWNGEPRFCRERWQFWRKRLGELAVSEEISNDLRRIARDAEAQMGDIDAESE